MRNTGWSQGTFSPIDRPMRSAVCAHLARQCFTAYTQLVRQTSSLCPLGVQPKMLPCVYCCRQPRQRGLTAYTQLASTLKSPMATCGGATRIQLRASARRAVKVLIPLMMGTPWVGRCTRAQGVGRACARGRQTCLEEGSDLFRVTTNLILFRETGVLDRELNQRSARPTVTEKTKIPIAGQNSLPVAEESDSR